MSVSAREMRFNSTRNFCFLISSIFTRRRAGISVPLDELLLVGTPEVLPWVSIGLSVGSVVGSIAVEVRIDQSEW